MFKKILLIIALLLLPQLLTAEPLPTQRCQELDSELDLLEMDLTLLEQQIQTERAQSDDRIHGLEMTIVGKDETIARQRVVIKVGLCIVVGSLLLNVILIAF